MQFSKIERSFFRSVSVLLLFTAVAKIFSSMGQAGILQVNDSLFFIKNRYLLAFTGIVELGVVVLLWLETANMVKSIILLWLSSCFIAYRISIWILQPGKICPCLGTLVSRMPLNPQTVQLLINSLIGYMMIGSIAILLFEIYSSGLRSAFSTHQQ